MKKFYIILVLTLAAAAAIIVYTVDNAGSYASFADATAKPDREHRVSGYLNLEKEIRYNPRENANLFSFFMKDKKDGRECKVYFNGAKPQDFERSEEVVITGKMKGDSFYATKILMKCPSKYNDASEVTEITANS
ncbi:MAG: cytochrome c maturation protein CcmE [Bacteroidia bacterium]|nr:cytochrome c maturation protein CcmE [Bacteroidia bacterium]